MNRKLNLANVILSVLFGLTLLFSAVQPVSVSASNVQVEGGIRRSVHPQTGKLSFLGVDPTSPLRVERAMERGLSPEMRGKAILDVYGREFGLKNAEEELRFTSSHENDGRGTVKYQQVYQGIPILAGELIVNTNAQGALLSINGEVSPDLNLSTKPNIDSVRATGIALSEIASAYRLATSELTISEPALWIYDARLLNGNDKTPAHLVWRMEVTSENAPLRELVLVNAQNGKISLHFNQIDTVWSGKPTPVKEDNALDLALSQVSERDSVDENIAILPALVVIPADIDRFVSSTTGVDSGDCKDKNSPCLTIAYAISQMADGDVIGAEQGLYNESVVFPYGCNKSVTLSGGWNGAFDAQGGYSTIDGEKIRQGLSVWNYCTVSVDHLIIQNGYGYSDGGGIFNSGNLTISTSIIQNNNANQYGGGIYNDGSLLILYSAISNNTAKVGGGGVAGFFTAQNTTFARNKAAKGGAIHHFGNSYTTLNNVTFTENQATLEGGTLYNTDTGTSVRLKNSILVSGSAGACTYYPGSKAFVSLGHNLFNRKCTITLDPTDFNVIDPRIGGFLPSLGYAPLLADSPAVNSGGVCAGNIDQRGQSRVGVCDIGAFEYVAPGAAVSFLKISGDEQTSNPTKNYPRPLVILALDSGGNPVPGTQVMFDTPISGPTATFAGTGLYSQTLPTDVYGKATSSLLTANSEYGTFDVNVSALGATPVFFSLENLMWTVLSTTGSDLNTCKTPLDPCQTIQGAISKAPIGDTIYVAEGTYTSSGEEVVKNDKGLSLSGGWNANFDTQTGYSTIDGENTRRGITMTSGQYVAVMDRFIVTNGVATSNGGGILVSNGNTLKIINSTISNNFAVNGGGIYADASTALVIVYSTINNNQAVSPNPSLGSGGGLYSLGRLAMVNSAIYGNYAQYEGGGIDIAGTNVKSSISNSTIATNRAGYVGGVSAKNTTLNNVTITENYGGIIGGLSGALGGGTILKNSILANNHSLFEGILDHYGNCDTSRVEVSGKNIIYPFCPVILNTGSVVLQVDPKMGNFIPGLGYAPLTLGSPAINAGLPATCITSGDQRGQTRIGICDLGAFEYVTNAGTPAQLLLVSGSQQRAAPNTIFSNPLIAVVVDGYGNPVINQEVVFTTPGSGASAAFADGANEVNLTTDSKGYVATSLLTANGETGDFIVAAAHNSGTINFNLSNGSWYIIPSADGGSDLNDCKTDSTPCATLNGVLNKPDFLNRDLVQMKMGTYPAPDWDIFINKGARISGGWDTGFLAQTGLSTLDFAVYPDPTFELGWDASTSFDKVDFYGVEVINHANMTFENGSIRGGGGLNNAGNLTVRNATISGNSHAGIYNNGLSLIESSTIAQNTNGGGIYNYFGFITIGNSIVIGNQSGDMGSSGIYSNGHNIVGIASVITSIPSMWTTTDMVGDAKHPIRISSVLVPTLVLDPVSGQWYYPLKLGSLALEAGSTGVPGSGGSTCPLVDQRGVARPQGVYCDVGSVEYQFNKFPASYLLVTYTAKNKINLPGAQYCASNDASCSNPITDAHAQKAHTYAYSAYQWYQTWHGRNSIDGNDLQINSTVHFGTKYQNAFWNGYMLVFGDGYGYPLADDVVAHEYTHGVTEYESNLFYWYQSGAINESFSDLWGEAIDQANGLGNDAANVKWQIGEDIGGLGAIRNMADPTKFEHPDRISSPLYCKSGACLEDNGGVHTNSGVNNKAVYLMVNGGTFNGRTVTKLQWLKVLTVYYEAQTNLLTSGSDYLDLYNALYQACSNKVGTNGIGTPDCLEVRDALLAVEMNLQPATNFNPDTTFCPAKTYLDPTYIFYEDFESGTDGWTLADFFDRHRWELSGENARAGLGSLWSEDSPKNGWADATTKVIRIPKNIKPYLYFAHDYSFDADGSFYYDGGVLEYSTNGGQIWYDAGTLFSAGRGYNGSLRRGYGNPYEGRSAFVGDSHGYVGSRYSLAKLVGQSVRFRWILATDDTVGAPGWYLDDVRVYRCVGIPSVPSLISPVNGAKLENLTPLIDWSNSTPDLHHYQLQLATDQSFTENLQTYNNILVSAFSLPTELGSNATYYWRARAFNAAGKASAWSTVWSFTTP